MLQTKTQTFYVIELYTKMTTACGVYETIPYYLSNQNTPTSDFEQAKAFDKPLSVEQLTPYRLNHPESRSICYDRGILFD